MFALQRIVALKEALKGGTLIECTGPNGGPRRFLTYSDGTYFELRRLSDSAVDAGIVLISADVPKEVSRRILDWRRERSINEARLLTLADMGEEGSVLSVTVTAEVSKTYRGRTIPVTDERVAERMRRRMEEADDDAEALLFPAPAASGSVWDLNNAEHAIKKLYRELADELDIPLLREVSTHVWRATLNTEWMQRGIPEVIRSAYFGHSPEVNRNYYTDTTNVSVLVGMLRQGNGESV